MTTDQPWYLTLFQQDYYNLIAPGGPGSSITPEEMAQRTDAEVDFVLQQLDLPAGAPIFDLCCGWGRHTIRMAQRGYRLTGLDLSTYHIELARKAAAQAGVEVEWLEGDMRKLPCPDASYPAVTNLWTSFGYFDDAENQQVLNEVARILQPGGRFLIDVINRDHIIATLRDRDWTEEANGALTLERHRWDTTTGRLYTEWTHIDREGNRRNLNHDERMYTLQELTLMLANAGLQVCNSFGAFDGRPLSLADRRLIILAQRP